MHEMTPLEWLAALALVFDALGLAWAIWDRVQRRRVTYNASDADFGGRPSIRSRGGACSRGGDAIRFAERGRYWRP
jgi:hypothetical protein